jgi:peptidoglycan-associated lipoprotein
MKANSLKIVAIAAALALTAGCGKKAPKQIPPGPVGSETAGEDTGVTDPNGGVGTEVLPGSRADFIQTVGQGGDRIFFDTDQYNVDDQDRTTLDQQAAWLMRNTAVRVTIEGHADERGTREYNLALGDRRANSVRNYLESRGVSGTRMTTISWGKERPAAEGSSEEAWAQNRRSVTVLPN